ncbi:MAG: hypothetical protein JF625_21505 [Inquilinus limosus]|uniref:Uncharacterized protein n=1 Tax=Inquilinus limosus TaxID=171674 RepID=A0A952FSX7_9PROT|nr:hypothetical protein [Inquilinus limosus]
MAAPRADLVEIDPENVTDNVVSLQDGSDTIVGGAGSDRRGIDSSSKIENVTFTAASGMIRRDRDGGGRFHPVTGDGPAVEDACLAPCKEDIT